MARTGPVTKDTSAIALGLAQIRVGASVINIATATSVLVAADSIGALANTKYMGEVSYWKLESGFPLLEDITLPIRESSSLECSFKEVTSTNLALARGLDPADFADGHAGSIPLGTIAAPEFIRMEAVYTYPNGTNTMTIIFPRANVVSSTEIDLQAEDAANVPITFEAKRADSEVTGGDAAWDLMPLGQIIFA